MVFLTFPGHTTTQVSDGSFACVQYEFCIVNFGCSLTSHVRFSLMLVWFEAVRRIGDRPWRVLSEVGHAVFTMRHDNNKDDVAAISVPCPAS